MTIADWLPVVGQGILETLYMTLVSTLFAYVLGLPLGLWLVVTAPDSIRPNAAVQHIVGGIVNALRSAPFLILLMALIPLTRLIVGTSIGSPAMIPPLVIAAFPFVARMVESSAKEVDRGVIEAATSMGASPLQVVCKVILPEAKPSLIIGAAIATTTILGYTAMAGVCGAGGLGAIAINYGYYRGQTGVMWAMMVLLVIIVQVFQEIGNWLARKCDRRIR
jgi:ABC-type metal ion transport system, permease component